MSMNRIQFQPGMSVNELHKAYRNTRQKQPTSARKMDKPPGNPREQPECHYKAICNDSGSGLM